MGISLKLKTILLPRLSGGASFVWRSLVWGKDLLKTGIHWQVGNGDSIYVYRDKWVSRPSIFTVISPPKLDVNTKVCQLITPSGGWNLQLLKYNFSTSDVNDIIRIPIGKRDKKDDIIWHYDGKGNYTVRSGYWIGCNLLSSHSPSTPHPSTSWWNLLWKLWIPTKVKIFI
ncbi:hypothetical protein Ddye_028412 [Dipteronia dyeriana]|uniref:Uncharacterized protein n=1 Tax=Dipteronia dyeriana TaxID=168575 RepID=A0AAD9TRF2_9ROSI|nr:hypothetical protein Ddye_028412 [Dipteronia dyeriana]